MQKILIPFANPVASVNKENLIERFRDCLNKGTFILGENVADLEKIILRDYFPDAERVLAVGSGTDALEIAVRSIMAANRWAVEDTFIVTVANSAPATITPFLRVGFNMQFVDVDASGLMYLADLAKALNKIAEEEVADIRGIRYHIIVVPVDLYGQAVDIESIAMTTRAIFPKAAIVRDAAQSFGAIRSDRYSDAIAISFYPTKNLGCFGDGGAIVFNNEDIAGIAESLRFYGITDRQNLIQERYGYNSRLDEIQAAFLLERLEDMAEYAAQRDFIAKNYRSIIDEKFRLHYSDDGNYHIFPCIVKNRAKIRMLMQEAGIGTSIHYQTPAHKQPAYALKKNTEDHLTVTEWLCDHELSLPIWPGMREVEVLYVAETFNKIAKIYA